MNINIQKMQSGGGMAPFTYYQPVMVNTQRPERINYDNSSSTSGSKSGSDADKGKLTDKDLMSMLGQIDGLPSDMNSVFSLMQRFYKFQDLGIQSPSSLSTQYLRALQSVKVAQFNKKEFDKAYQVANKNGALNEKAITTDGRIVVIDPESDTPSLKLITIDEYNQNQNKYSALTNSNLLDFRAQYGTNQNGIFDVVNNSISLATIHQLIKNYLGNIGSSENSTDKYEQRKSKQIMNGITTIQNAYDEGQNVTEGGLDGLYKITNSTKQQKQQAVDAIKYIWSMLPQNAKTLLKLHSGSDKDAQGMIISFVTSQTSDNNVHKETLVTDLEGHKLGSKSSSKSDDKEEYADQFTNIVEGIGGSYTTFTLQNENGNTYSVDGISYPNLSLNPTHEIKEGSLQDLMDYGYSSIVKSGNSQGGQYAISFGNQILDHADFKDIAFLNDQQATRTILPIKFDNETGKIIPDLEFAENNKDVINLINKKGLNDPEVISKLKNIGLIDEHTGRPDSTKFQSYLCINGLGTSRNISDKSYVTEITGDDLEKNINIFENSVYKSKGKDGELGKEYKFNFDTQDWYDILSWFGDYDHMYKGTIFIPLTENIAQAKIGAGTNVKVSNQDNMEKEYQMFDKKRYSGIQNTSSNILFQ